MRTTLDIDDDLLAAAKELARRERKSAGQVVSELMRKGLTGTGGPAPASTGATSGAVAEQAAAYGLHPFPPGDVVATNDQVNRLREELGI
ncbi:MAG: hypothetical protein U0T03_12825 [Xanthomonadales bacterium]|nr:hypothetical protein [Pseudoxanthomonas sp.]MDZ3799672.1 hypothetical protein [Xanthomonadales bacterium]